MHNGWILKYDDSISRFKSYKKVHFTAKLSVTSMRKSEFKSVNDTHMSVSFLKF